MKTQLHKMIQSPPVMMLALILAIIVALVAANPRSVRTTVFAQESGTATPAEEPAATAQPAEEATSPPTTAPSTVPSSTTTPTPAPVSAEELISTGQTAYSAYCAACHQADGQGIPNAYPALAGNGFVLTEDPSNVLRVIFTGRAGMPHFRNALSSQEIAAIVSYIRNSWDNEASTVSAAQVRAVEEEIYSPSEPMEHSGATTDEQPAATATPSSDDSDDSDDSDGTANGNGNDDQSASGTSQESNDSSDTQAVLARGEEIYAAECASCHRLNGEGTGAYPPLNNSELATATEPTGALQNILYGEGEMPAFDELLTSAEIAAVLSYVRNTWDNDASIVTAEEVEAVGREQ